MQIRARHWLVSFTLASVLHAGVLLAVDFGSEGPTVVGVGGGIRISLGDGTGTLGGGAPGAGDSPDADVDEGRSSPPSRPSPRAVAAAPPAPAPTPQIERAAAVVPTAPSALPTVAADAASVVPVPLDAAPVQAQASEPVQVAAVVAAPAPASEPDSLHDGAPPAVASAGSGSRGNGESSSDGSPSSGTGGASGDGGPLSDGSGQGGGEAGLAGLDPAYVRRFMASIERQKRYPRAARNQRLEGTALLWVRLDRSGRVLAYDVRESSGHVLLDRAVVRTIEHADPLPPLPASYPKAEVEMLIPIAFQLR